MMCCKFQKLCVGLNGFAKNAFEKGIKWHRAGRLVDMRVRRRWKNLEIETFVCNNKQWQPVLAISTFMGYIFGLDHLYFGVFITKRGGRIKHLMI